MIFQKTFKALSDSNRRNILIMLKNNKMTAGDISKEFDMTNATISYHLTQLKNADLVIESKFKNFVYYELNTSVFEEVMLWFAQFSDFDNKKGVDSNEEDEQL